jgi:import inner membrane translocase subunit TIM44
LEREARIAAERAQNPFLHDPDREVAPNLEAQGVVEHQESKWTKQWSSFKESNPIAQSWFAVKRNMDESDNPVVERLRDMVDLVGRPFQETETATTVKRFKQVDPKFRLDKFTKDAHEWIIPELMEAYLRGETAVLKEWCSEATFNVLTSGIKSQQQQGLVSDCKLVDLRNVELLSAKTLENEVPVLVMSFQTQEILLFRDAKTGEISVGKEVP